MTSNQSDARKLRRGGFREFDEGIVPPSGVRFLLGGTTVALGQLSRIELRSPTTGALQETIEGPGEKSGLSAWAVSPSGSRILWGGREADPRLLDRSGEELLHLALPADAASFLASESPGLGSSGEVMNPDGSTEDLSRFFPAYGTANDFAFLGGGDGAVVAYGQAYALVWDLQSAELLHVVGTEGSPEEPVRIYRVAAVENGSRIATVDTRPILRVLELGDREADGEPRELFSVRLDHDPYEAGIQAARDRSVSPNLFGGLGAIAFTPDGERIAAGDGVAVRVWDIGTGEELPSWTGHSDRHPLLGEHGFVPRIPHISFSKDGRRALSVGVDATIRVWDVESGGQIWADRPAPCCIDYADISPDGEYVFWAACPGMRLYAVG